MTTNFSKCSDSTFLQQLPNHSHRREVSSEVAFRKLGIDSGSSLTKTMVFCTKPNLTIWPKVSHGLINEDISNKTSSLKQEKYLSRLQPNQIKFSPIRNIRLIVHGSSGGKIDPKFEQMAQEVAYLRGTSVEIEALTNENIQISNSSSLYLVPLLLLPGVHVRNDIIKIRQRLRKQGVRVKLMPFLGACTNWLSAIQVLILKKQEIGKPVLVHHPLSKGIAQKYLCFLRERFQVPVVSWTNWYVEGWGLNDKYIPIPYCLAPNKNIKNLSSKSSCECLLENTWLRDQLIEKLILLP